MATKNNSAYLLTWNPNRWQWDELPEQAAAVSAGQSVVARWSTGNTRRIQPGDRLFLLRQGQDPRGLMASGTATSTVFQADHWDPEKLFAGIEANYVKLQFDTLLDSESDPILPRDLLISDPKLSGVHWNTQMSGMSIDPQVLDVLELRWREFAYGNLQLLPEEIEGPAAISEGAKKRITVNSYERNPHARHKCLQHYGYKCSICGLNIKEFYGTTGREIIHVHHLKPLAEIGEEYEIDPVTDLRPVCPNCHAVIHSRRPAYTIEEVKNFLIP